MNCPYCDYEITESDEICPSCAGNIKNFNKVLEVKKPDDIYTRRIIIKSCLLFFILFTCIAACIIILTK